MLECVVNVSEGRDSRILSTLRTSCVRDLLDVHSDADHHRSVFTLIGESAARNLTQSAVSLLDLSRHGDGVHPRLGVVDVVPFVPLGTTDIDSALEARQSFAQWAVERLNIPCFLYGPAHGDLKTARSLPEIRRQAWHSLAPDLGPSEPHPSAGAICVGARPVLVAYNIWMSDSSGGRAVRDIAATMRSASVRTLALEVGDRFQVSMNLVDPGSVGPAQVRSRVEELSHGTTAHLERCELVGLVPQSVLDAIPAEQWMDLDLSRAQTIEYRIARLSAGS